MKKEFEKGTKIYSSEMEQEGTTTGGSYPCTLEGCRGLRVGVKWPDGKMTYPCTKGLEHKEGIGWKII